MRTLREQPVYNLTCNFIELLFSITSSEVPTQGQEQQCIQKSHSCTYNTMWFHMPAIMGTIHMCMTYVYSKRHGNHLNICKTNDVTAAAGYYYQNELLHMVNRNH